jgi:hypothetical protein
MRYFLYFITFLVLISLYCIDSFAQSDTLVIKLKNNPVQDSIITSELQKIAFGFITVPDQEINLTEGWNMVSSFVEAGNALMDSIWLSILDDVIIVKDNEGNTFIPSYGINDIGNWNVTQGYQVYMNQDKTLVLFGTSVNPEITPIFLGSGWNMTSYLRNTAINAEEGFSTIADDENLIIAKDNDGNVYIPSYGINSIENLTPGQGYQLYVSNEDTLLYPANPREKNSVKYRRNEPKYLKIDFGNTGNNAVAIIKIPDSYNNDEVGLFNQQNKLIGSGVVQDGFAVVTFWGEDNKYKIIEAGKQNEKLTLKYFDIITQRLNNIEINNVDNLVKSQHSDFTYQKDAFYVIQGKVIDNSNNLDISVKPNPFTNEAEISFVTLKECNSNVEFYSLNGDKISTLFSGRLSAGNHTYILNSAYASSGEYNIIVNLDGRKYLKKVVIAK